MATPTCPIAKGSSNPGVTESVRAAAGSTAGAAGLIARCLPCGTYVPALLSREARVSPTAVPQSSEAGAWLARYGELQNSLFLTLARPLGMVGAGGRDAFGDLFQIAATAAWMRERDGEPIRNPRAFLRQVIINQRKMQLRTERRHPATSYDEIGATAGGSGIDGIADRRPSVSEQVERREVAEIVSHILLTVERRARTVWAMRYLEGRTPDEVVAALGITHRQYARLFERANTAINRKLLAYLAGDWCPGYAAKFARLAANRATASDAHDAREHLDACPSCRAAYGTFTRLHPSGA
jgi:RNA polymerase sigma factor (sigma-70 family)